MNDNSSTPYTKPNRPPTYKFINKQIMIEVYVNDINVEVFQHSATTQRFLMSRAEYAAFQAKITENGFAKIQ